MEGIISPTISRLRTIISLFALVYVCECTSVCMCVSFTVLEVSADNTYFLSIKVIHKHYDTIKILQVTFHFFYEKINLGMTCEIRLISYELKCVTIAYTQLQVKTSNSVFRENRYPPPWIFNYYCHDLEN